MNPNLETLLSKLETNLNKENDVKDTLKAAEKARKYISKKGYKDVAEALNCMDESYNLSAEDFAGAEMYTTKKFLKQFKGKWGGFKMPAVGILLDRKKGKKTLKKVGLTKEYNGVFFSQSEFKKYKNKNFPLNKTGLILLTQNTRYISPGFEHEAIHAAFRAYSQSMEKMGKKYYKPAKQNKENLILFLKSYVEMCFIDELSAYRVNVSFPNINWRWVQKTLLSDYIGEYFEDIKKEYKMNPKRKLSYLKKKLPQAVQAVKYLQKKFGDKALTKILFSVGPTAKEIDNAQYSSPFDDLLAWKKYAEKGKISKDYFEKIKRVK